MILMHSQERRIKDIIPWVVDGFLVLWEDDIPPNDPHAPWDRVEHLPVTRLKYNVGYEINFPSYQLTYLSRTIP